MTEKGVPSTEDRNEPTWALFGLIVVMIVLIIVGGGWLMWRRFGEPDNAGTFGDMFGVVNALFSGLAFAGVIFAILLQRQELRLQRRELTLTRSEVAGQKAALEAQNETLAEQSFHNAFFSLLRFHREFAGSIRVRPSGSADYAGAQAFWVAADLMVGKVMSARLQEQSEHATAWSRDIKHIYMQVCASGASDFEPYFANLAALIEFIEQDDTYAGKQHFVRLVANQFSGPEVTLLWFRSLVGAIDGLSVGHYVKEYPLIDRLNVPAELNWLIEKSGLRISRSPTA